MDIVIDEDQVEELVEELFDKRVLDDLDSIDMEERYDDMLNEIYSLDSIGGPFSNILASDVLKANDPVAYRCGFNDYLDSERDIVIEVNDEYYDSDELDKLKEEIHDEIIDDIEKGVIVLEDFE